MEHFLLESVTTGSMKMFYPTDVASLLMYKAGFHVVMIVSESMRPLLFHSHFIRVVLFYTAIRNSVKCCGRKRFALKMQFIEILKVCLVPKCTIFNNNNNNNKVNFKKRLYQRMLSATREHSLKFCQTPQTCEFRLNADGLRPQINKNMVHVPQAFRN